MNTERCSAHTHLQELIEVLPGLEGRQFVVPASAGVTCQILSRPHRQRVPAEAGTTNWLLLGLLVAFMCAVLPAKAQISLVATGLVWKYNDTGTDLGTDWRGTNYDDTAWASGPAQLGYGDGDEATVVSFGTDSNNKYPTTYFRLHFNVADASS